MQQLILTELVKVGSLNSNLNQIQRIPAFFQNPKYGGFTDGFWSNLNLLSGSVRLFLAIPINQKTTTRINYSMFNDICQV